jgi:N-acetylglutamate synthase-like GNAT family acetyltransferase
MTIRRCEPADFIEILDVVNDAALAYQGIIAADRWRDPYMPEDELRNEIDAGVVFWGAYHDGVLRGVMGLQHVGDVALVRHAYTRTADQGSGIGATLLARVRSRTERPMLIGTWSAATWAVRFYERHGFHLVSDAAKETLLRRYWDIPDRQVEESVVLADERFLAMHTDP